MSLGPNCEEASVKATRVMEKQSQPPPSLHWRWSIKCCVQNQRCLL